MKNLKETAGILAIAFVSLTAVACKNETKKSDVNANIETMEMDQHHHDAAMDHAAKDEDMKMEAATQQNEATAPIIKGYLQIKNALVKDDKDGAAQGATMMLEAFSSFDMSKLNQEQHKSYMDIVADAKEQAEHIAKSPLEHQREHFVSLSIDVADLITLLGTDKKLYQDYCPMAKASWLSETKDIKNPYYGSKMLTCGTVKKEIN